ncbi:MAG: hypothetical protein JKX92_12215 [Porticoccaceae bacterium]|nr:hypothetical protein [Porticoccaceae bacterium]
MSELSTYDVISPVSVRGEITKSGTVDLTAFEAKHLLSLPEPCIAEPGTEPGTQIDTGSTGGTSDPKPLTEARIVEAIDQLDPDSAELWTKGNAPQVTALEAALGQPVTATERDAAWAAYQASQPAQ